MSDPDGVSGQSEKIVTVRTRAEPKPYAGNSAPAIFSVNTYTNYSSSDYNGVRPNPGAGYSFQWNSPPWNGTFPWTTAP
jgi:hypothetical protein